MTDGRDPRLTGRGSGARSPNARTGGLSRRRLLRIGILGGLLAVAGWRMGTVRRVARWLDARRRRVALVACEGYGRDIEPALARALDLGMFPDVAGRSVLLKPNLIDFDPARPLSTHPALVAALARIVTRRGARSVAVAEGPGNRRDVLTVLGQTGLGALLERDGVPFVDLNTDDLVRVDAVTLPLDEPSLLGTLLLPASAVRADLVVSVAKLKTHHWSGMTLSMKNLFGVVPGVRYGWPKNLLHWNGIDRSILELALTIRPGFSVIDAVVAMEGEGPLLGRPCEVGAIVAGTDPIAVDAVGAMLSGVRPAGLGYLEAADLLGLGRIDPSRLDIAGEPLARRMRRLVLPAGFERIRG